MEIRQLYLHPETRKQLIEEVLTSRERINHEIIYKKKDGSPITVAVTITPVRDSNNKVIYFDGILEDITETKRIQEHLLLSDRLASVGQLASGIAHELNNPLTSVIGFSEILMKSPLPEETREDLKIVHDEARRASQIVKGLLAFARKDAAKKELLDLHSVLESVLRLRSYEQKVNNITLKTELAENLPPVMGNAAQIQQVFINLIINAEQEMIRAHGKGTLTITSGVIQDGVKISFSDDGQGISPENMKKIFTPFFTTKEVGKGTGLGLSICHGIITEHGGKIYAESEPGRGATFIIELPIAK
jgi:signal transduction histidine kinase